MKKPRTIISQGEKKSRGGKEKLKTTIKDKKSGNAKKRREKVGTNSTGRGKKK